MVRQCDLPKPCLKMFDIYWEPRYKYIKYLAMTCTRSWKEMLTSWIQDDWKMRPFWHAWTIGLLCHVVGHRRVWEAAPVWCASLGINLWERPEILSLKHVSKVWWSSRLWYQDIQRISASCHMFYHIHSYSLNIFFDILRIKRYPALAPQDWRVRSQVWRLYKKEKSVSAWSPLRCHLES